MPDEDRGQLCIPWWAILWHDMGITDHVGTKNGALLMGLQMLGHAGKHGQHHGGQWPINRQACNKYLEGNAEIT